MDRENSPAITFLPDSARRLFEALVTVIGNGSEAAVSYAELMDEHCLGRITITRSTPLLVKAGLIGEIKRGAHGRFIYSLSNNWRTKTEDDVRVAILSAGFKLPKKAQR